MQVLTTNEPATILAILSHFGGVEGLRYDQRIARHALDLARQNLRDVRKNRAAVWYPAMRRSALARVARCNAAVLRLVHRRETMLTKAMQATWLDRIVAAETLMSVLANDITIPAKYWAAAMESRYALKDLRRELVALTAAPVEVEVVL